MPSFPRHSSILLPLAAVTVFGCGEAKPPDDPKQTEMRGSSPYSIKAYARSGDQRELARYLPVGASLSEVATETGAQTQELGQTSQALTVRLGGDTFDLEELTVSPGDHSVDALAGALLFRCGLGDDFDSSDPSVAYGSIRPKALAGSGFWSSPDQWHVLNDSQLDTCDEVLAAQEIYLCAADYLAQIGDTVVVLEIPFGNDSTLEVPPQAERDKFIVRDAALNLLAHLSLLEYKEFEPQTFQLGTTVIEGTFPDATCTDGYLHLLEKNDKADEGILVSLFGQNLLGPYEHFPPVAESVTELVERGISGRDLARARLETKLHILRSAARLTRDLIDKSVTADMAGAEQQRASAGDDLLGARLMWGEVSGDSNDAGFAPYNSLRHAQRTLFGRLESGRDYEALRQVDPEATPPDTEPGERPGHDPECHGFRSLLKPTQQAVDDDLRDLMDSLGPGYSARWFDEPVSTDGEALATSLVQMLGAIVPPGDRDSARDDVLREGIIVKAQQRAGLVTASGEPADGITDAELDAFAESPAVQLELDIFEQLGDEDLDFGLDRAWAAFRLLADVPEGATDYRTRGENVGLAFMVDLPLLQRPLPRSEALRNAFGQMLPAAAASQCKDLTPSDGSDGAPEFGEAGTFQSAFMLGDSLRRRLGVIRDAAKALDEASLASTAQLATSEIRAWTGPGRVHYRRLHGTSTRNIHEMTITGIDDDWFPLSTDDLPQLEDHLELVYGSPIDAACAAGARTSCPPDSEIERATIVRNSASPIFLDADSEAMAGNEGRGLRVRFSVEVEDTSTANFHNGLLHLVLKQDPSSLDDSGRVLAAFAPLEHTGGQDRETADVISDYRVHLTNQAFGIPTDFQDNDLCAGDNSSTSPAGYCIEGVARDFFVPLANELTSSFSGSEDSWRHYLSLAEEAAARTDELGRQLIDIGLQTDLRREAAQEELGLLCGDFLAADGLNVQGDTPSTDDNAVVNACFDEEKFDLVFLGNNPFGDAETLTGDDLKALRDVMCGSSTGGWCDRERESITVGALGLDVQSPTVEVTDCSEIYEVLKAPHSGLAAEALKPYATTDALQQALLNLRYAQQEDGQWSLWLRDQPLMGWIPDVLTHSDGDRYTPPLDPTLVFPLCRNFNARTTCSSDADCSVAEQCVRSRCSRCEGVAAAFEQSFESLQDFVVGQEVQRAVYFMAAMTGMLPANRVVLPVPVANLASLDLAQPLAVYGHGRFDSTPDGFRLNQDQALGVSEGDARIFGVANAVDPQYADMLATYVRSAAAQRDGTGFPDDTVPIWYEELVDQMDSDPGTHLVRQAANASMEFLPSDWDGFIGDLIQSVAATDEIDGGPLTEIGFLQGCVNNGVPVFREFDSGSNFGGFPANDRVRFIDTFVHEDEYFDIVPPPDWHAGFQLDGNVTPGASQEGLYYGETDICDQLDGLLSPACVDSAPEEARVRGDIGFNGVLGTRYSRHVTLPRRCTPGERVPFFMNRWIPETSDRHLQKRVVAQALALSCTANGGFLSTKIPPPPGNVQTVGDVVALGAWVRRVGDAARRAAGALFMESVPKTVVDAFREGRVADAGVTNQGLHGQKLLELREKLEQVLTGWVNASSAVVQLGNAIDGASVQLELAAIAHRQRLLDIASAEANIDRDMALSSLSEMATTTRGLMGVAGGIVGGAAQGGPAGAALGGLTSLVNAAVEAEVAGRSADISAQWADRQRNINNARESESAVEKQARQQAIFVDLSRQTQDLHTSLQNSLSQMKIATAEALRVAADLNNNENQARFEAAKASGSDFVRLDDGSVVPLPVNTVLRRQYDVTRRRYEEALHRAKRLAYMARLAIEQRIGVRLDAVRQPVGALEAPSLWADDVCSLQGIDYAALRTATQPGLTVGEGGSGSVLVTVEEDPEEALIGEFADAYIGDYVQKLKEFVEFYNIEFPFQEADDRAVVSLQERLLTGSTGCNVESRNLLHFSDALNEGSSTSTVPYEGGWGVNACVDGDVECLEVIRLDVLDGTDAPPIGVGSADAGVPPLRETLAPPGGIGGTSWIRLTDPSSAAPSLLGTEAPARTVYQAVNLVAQGHYVLSWWDRALDAVGDPAEATVSGSYQAAIYDENWRLIGVVRPVAAGGDAWSRRRSLDVIAPVGGTYFVAFQLDGGIDSLGIANVQLEVAAPSDGFTSGYESTGASRVIFSRDCLGAEARVQDAFTYKCEGGACFHELRTPFLINTSELDARASNLSGLVGAGNYNYRHRALGVNLVGSGVLDCSGNPSPACFGQGFVEYDLYHDAYDVPVVDYGGQSRCFTFGTGAIRGGKALATERYITTPLGSADEGLLGQPGITRREFAGRPMSGLYRLRIIDNPALDWERVEDIQLVVDYRAWSRVTRAPAL